MSDEIIIRNCSPTLAGLKTGNIFCCKIESKESLMRDIRKLNKALTKKGLRVIPLKVNDDKAMVYVFRPGKLKKDLSQAEATDLLSNHGYACKNPEYCVVKLIDRINASDTFPHEIGFFLGYPPEDVLGFIETKTPKCSGYWQVYGDEKKAKKTFAKYNKCTEVYMQQLIKGNTLERLTVAV